MKTRLGEEKDLTGKRVDTNWLKYKIYKDTKYLRKLNELINKLVIIDNEIERRKGKSFNLQNDQGSQTNNKGYRTTEKGKSQTTEHYSKGHTVSTQVEKRTGVFLGRNHNFGVVWPAQSAETGGTATPCTDGLNPNTSKVPLFFSHGPYQNQQN